MERIIAAVLTGTVVLSLGGAALAQQHEGGMMGHGMGGHGMGPRIDFDTVDADKDGKVTPAEVTAARAARFAAADANADGKLDRAELAAQAQKMMAERMAARALDMLDADRDGALSAEEMADGPGMGSRMFTRIDADKDGALTRAEVDAARENMRGEHGKRHEGRYEGRNQDRSGN